MNGLDGFYPGNLRFNLSATGVDSLSWLVRAFFLAFLAADVSSVSGLPGVGPSQVKTGCLPIKIPHCTLSISISVSIIGCML